MSHTINIFFVFVYSMVRYRYAKRTDCPSKNPKNAHYDG